MKDKSKRLRIAFYGTLLSALFIVACSEAPPKPSTINPSDTCFYCKSPIADLKFAAEFVSKDGFVRKFDDFGCLIANARRVGKKNIKAFFVMDIRSSTWTPAEQASFIKSDKIMTPRNGGIMAFKDSAAAQEVAKKLNAETLKLEDLIK
jgi:hypothetical protein